MQIKAKIEQIPGGLMIVPLLLGALFNTFDKLHLEFVQNTLKLLNATPNSDGKYELLSIGGFSSAMMGGGAAVTFIALFLVCAGAQMNPRIGLRALKKGLAITIAKFGMAFGAGALFAYFFDPFNAFLGLSVLAVVAAMENSNGGLYVALTGQYGNRSDIGAIAVLSLNDGPLFTFIILSMLGATGIMQGSFPFIVFIAVLLPILIGMTLANLDEEIRTFLKPGERLLVPFFAFALGTTMNFAVFLNLEAILGGVVLGAMTTLLTGGAGILALKLLRERSQIAGAAEGSTAGNATFTPLIVITAAIAASKLDPPLMDPQTAEAYRAIGELATAHVTIACLATALFCPLLTIFWFKLQLNKGIDGRVEETE